MFRVCSCRHLFCYDNSMSHRTEVDAFDDLRKVLARLDEVSPAFDRSARGSEDAMKLGREQEELRARIPVLLDEISAIVKQSYNVP